MDVILNSLQDLRQGEKETQGRQEVLCMTVAIPVVAYLVSMVAVE